MFLPSITEPLLVLQVSSDLSSCLFLPQTPCFRHCIASVCDTWYALQFSLENGLCPQRAVNELCLTLLRGFCLSIGHLLAKVKRSDDHRTGKGCLWDKGFACLGSPWENRPVFILIDCQIIGDSVYLVLQKAWIHSGWLLRLISSSNSQWFFAPMLGISRENNVSRAFWIVLRIVSSLYCKLHGTVTLSFAVNKK